MFKRLLEVLGVKRLDEAAALLDMNPATFRGRKSRGAVPFEEIVRKLNANDLIYVLIGERVNQKDPDSHDSGDRIEDEFERFSVELIKRIEEAPFSRQAKLHLIDSLIRIVEQDMTNMSQPAGTGASFDDVD
ncbi:hypothetical protein BH23BAC3_BH23BAC3_32860 [soil metagenome]